MHFENWGTPEDVAPEAFTEPVPSEEGIPDGTAPPSEDTILEMEKESSSQSDIVLSEEPEAPAPEQKPKRSTRRKRVTVQQEEPSEQAASASEAIAEPEDADVVTTQVPPQNASILTIHAKDEIRTEDEKDDIIWHQINNAFYTRKILPGVLVGVEQTETGTTLGIVDYKGFRIIIPLKEMMIVPNARVQEQSPRQRLLFQAKILGSMLGSEVDFMVKGIDKESRSVAGSRKDAMLRKRQIFYLDENDEGYPHIYEGRIVQARVVGVSEKAIRVEVFGVECTIVAGNISWEWIGDARDRYHIGDQVLVRVTEIQKDDVENIKIQADMKSISQNNSRDNLRKCRIQSKYAGKVTDAHKGIVYVRLSNGVNAIAHTCLDFRMPGKKDDVSFAVTRLDEDRGVAVGIITRIIRQNL